MAQHVKGISFIVAGYSAFAWGDAIAKELGHSFGAIETVCFINLFLLFFLLAASPWLGGLGNALRTPLLPRHLCRGALFALGIGLFVYALQHLALAKAYTILFMMPFFSSLLAVPMLGEKIEPYRWWLIVLGFTGVLIILRPGFLTLEPAALCALLAAAVFALFDVMTRQMGKGEVWISFALYPAVVTVMATGAILSLDGGFSLPGSALLLLAFAAAGAGHLGGSLLTARGYILTPISLAAPFQYAQLLWGVLLGRIFFQEFPDLWTLAGGFCIVAGGLSAIIIENRRHKIASKN